MLNAAKEIYFFLPAQLVSGKSTRLLFIDVTGASSAPARKLPKRTSRQAPPRTQQVARYGQDYSRC